MITRSRTGKALSDRFRKRGGKNFNSAGTRWLREVRDLLQQTKSSETTRTVDRTWVQRGL